jgi:hypothetical protein
MARLVSLMLCAVLLLAATPSFAEEKCPHARGTGDVFAIEYAPNKDLTPGLQAFAVDGLNVLVTMTKGAKALTPIAFRVAVNQGGKPVAVKDAEIAFNMAMDMGRHVAALSKDGDAWKGEIVLPPCAKGGKRWYGRLRFTAEGAAHEVVFLFDLA